MDCSDSDLLTRSQINLKESVSVSIRVRLDHVALVEIPITPKARSVRAAQRIAVRTFATKEVHRENDRGENEYCDSWSGHRDFHTRGI
jgi:hypothetical protein